MTATDYDPFGMQLDDRKYNTDKYRFGFNGKENDNDVKGEGNQQDYGMRIYDPRVGRFLSVDPLTSDYPSWTPYAFAMNRTIDGIDLDGLEWRNSTQQEIKNYQNNQNKNQGEYGYVGMSWTNANKPEYMTWTGKHEFDANGNRTTYDARAIGWDGSPGNNGYLSLFNSDGSISTFKANKYHMVELPMTKEASNGDYTINGDTWYRAYNRRDNNNTQLGDQYSNPSAMARMLNSIMDYKCQYPCDDIAIGEMRNMMDGPTYKDNKGGLHHKNKNAYDIRLLGSNGSYRGSYTDANFSYQKTQRFIDALGRNGFKTFIINKVPALKLNSSGSINVSKKNKQHKDHYHIND